MCEFDAFTLRFNAQVTQALCAKMKYMSICHFYKVDHNNIEANFTNDELHRSTLTIPFQERPSEFKLCIVGQNPSAANEVEADKT